MFFYVIVILNIFMIFYLRMNIFYEILFVYVLEIIFFLIYCILNFKIYIFLYQNSFIEVRVCSSINFELLNIWDNIFYWLVKGEMRKCIKYQKVLLE